MKQKLNKAILSAIEQIADNCDNYDLTYNVSCNNDKILFSQRKEVIRIEISLTRNLE